MTQQQIIKEFQKYPLATKSAVIKRLQKIYDENLDEAVTENRELSVAERLALVESLAGIGAVAGKTPPTDEEWREERTNYLLEKYK